MFFLCSIADDYEPRNMLRQWLLFGPWAYHVLHPKNVEALLSTNFAGTSWGFRRPTTQSRPLNTQTLDLAYGLLYLHLY